MAFDDSNLEVYDRTHRAHDTAAGACVCQWNVFGTKCAKTFLGFEHVDIPFVRNSDKVEYVLRLCKWLQEGTDSDTLDLACCYLRKPFISYCLVREVDEY